MSLLIVDDSKVVRASLTKVLTAGGYHDLTEAASAEEAFSLLGLATATAATSDVSLILIDHTMPGMMGNEAVERIRADARYAELPIIMVTAHADDQTLRKAYDAGVTDYVRKPFNKTELLARVRTALKLGETLRENAVRSRRLAQATNELLESHKAMARANRRLASVIEASPAAIFTVLEGGLVESWNAGAERIFGWRAHEAIGQPLKINPAGYDAEGELIRDAMLNGRVLANIGTQRVRKDGTVIDVMLSIAPLDYTNGMVAVAEDITERKRMERDLRAAYQRLETMIDDSPVAVHAFDASTGEVHLWNPAAERLFGWASHEVLGGTLPILPDAERGSTPTRARQLREAGGWSNGQEAQRLHKDGTLIDVNLSVALIPGPAGTGDQILAFAEDITQRKLWERDIETMNGRLSAIIDSSPIAMYAIDADAGIVRLWNPAAQQMYGWSASEVLGRRLPTWPAEEEHGQDAKRLRDVREAGGRFTGQDRQRLRKDGTKLDVSLSVALLPGPDGGPQQMLCFTEDITERKRVEATLQRTNRRLGGIISTSPTAIYSVRVDGVVETWNPGAERIFGWMAHEVVGRQVPFLPSEHEPEMPLVRAMVETGEPIANLEVRRVRKDGALIDVSVSMAPMGSGAGFVSIAEDITERKRVERALETANASLGAVIAGSPLAIWTLDTNRHVTSWNAAAERMFGWMADEVVGRPLPIVSPAQQREWEAHSAALELGSVVRGAEVQRTRKDGSVVDIALSVAALGDGSRIGMAEDITERKLAQAAVARAKERLNAIIQASPAAIYTYSGSRFGTVETWNAAAERIFGWTPEEAVGQPLQVRAPDGVSEGEEVLQALRIAGGLVGVETQRVRKDGSVVDVSLSLAPLGKGSMELVSVVEDITERKQTERAMKELNQRLDAIIQASPSAIYATGDDGMVTAWNAAAERIFGWTASEVLGHPLPMIMPGTSAAYGVIKDALAQGTVINGLEVQRRHKDGRTLEVSLSISPLAADTSSAICVAEDITERKLTERALLSAHDRLTRVIEDSPIAIYALEADSLKVKLWNAASERMFGWSAAEVVGMPIPTVPSHEAESGATLVSDVLVQGSVAGSEVERMRKDGSRLFVSLSLAAVPGPDGGPDELLAFCEDITERKRAQHELLRSREEYRLLVDHATDIVYRSGLDGVFSYVNPAAIRVTGYTPQELIGKRLTDLVVQDYRSRVERFYRRQYIKREESTYQEFPIETKNGDEVWVGQNVTLTLSGSGEPLGFQAILRDVSEQRANESALQQLSLSDALTGIGNRRCFDDFLDREWRRAARERTSLALVMCDVDFFKKYNDSCGHPAGDRVLHAVAQAIGASLKRPADLATRYGGEEFALLLPNTPVDGALHIAEQARLAVEALGLPHPEGVSGVVTLSLGVAALSPAPGSNPAILIQAADRALYAAKEGGRNRVSSTDDTTAFPEEQSA